MFCIFYISLRGAVECSVLLHHTIESTALSMDIKVEDLLVNQRGGVRPDARGSYPPRAVPSKPPSDYENFF